MHRDPGSIRVLHVDDEPDFADMAAEFLAREDDRLEVDTATSVEAGLATLEHEPVDCVVSDYDMPEMNGIELLEAVREDLPNLPFILFTGKGSEEVAGEAISAGATDYLQKRTGTGQYELLANRVLNAVDQYRAGRRATELDRIRTLASDVNQTLVRADSREAALSRVCEIFSESDPYRFAWIGELDDETSRLVPRASAGIEQGYLDAITVTVDESPTGRGPAGRAIREGHVAISQNVLEDPSFEPWREEAIERGYRSVAGVPIEHRGEVYGGLVVYADRHDAFDEDERDLLAEVGADIGHVLDSFETQERLREERAFIDQALDTLDDLFCVVGTDTRIRRWNQPLADVTGYDDDELRGKPVVELFPEDEREALAEAMAATFEHGSRTIEADLLAADGSRVPFELIGAQLRDSDGQVTGLVGLGRDIADRRERERKVTALHDVAVDLETSESVSAICERTVAASEQILEFDMSAIDLEEDGYLTKVAISADVPLDNTTSMSVEEGIAGKTYRTGESTRITDLQNHPVAKPQGPYESAISVPIGDHGVFQAVAEEPDAFGEGDLELAELLLSHTESALSRLVRERELERRNERLEEFASIVSHDLRNPLNVAEGRLMLAREVGDGEDDNLAAVARAHDRMQALIDDLLALAREGQRVHDPTAVDLADLVERCWENVESESATVAIETTGTIRADRNRLSQLLENLFRNAVQHGGAAVTVTVGDLEDGFYVEDDGTGIPEADAAHVFETGYSTAEDGTGIGLDIVEEIVAAHGWEIDLTESDEGGARFEVTGVEIE